MGLCHASLYFYKLPIILEAYGGGGGAKPWAETTPSPASPQLRSSTFIYGTNN